MTNYNEKLFKALAHEKRLKILNWLKDPTTHFPPQIAGDLVKDGVCIILIAQKLKIKQPTATQHIKILIDAGLVNPTKIGKWTFIKRNEKMFDNLKSIIENEV